MNLCHTDPLLTLAESGDGLLFTTIAVSLREVPQLDSASFVFLRGRAGRGIPILVEIVWKRKAMAGSERSSGRPCTTTSPVLSGMTASGWAVCRCCPSRGARISGQPGESARAGGRAFTSIVIPRLAARVASPAARRARSTGSAQPSQGRSASCPASPIQRGEGRRG